MPHEFAILSAVCSTRTCILLMGCKTWLAYARRLLMI